MKNVQKIKNDSSNPPEPAQKAGELFLIPTPLGAGPHEHVLPELVRKTLYSIDTFFVERIRQTVSFLKWIKHPVPDYKCRFFELNKHTPAEDLLPMIRLLKEGNNAAILSEAGCPAVADPGGTLVALAHEAGIRVIPLVGPSSIILALMASGLNGQLFSFNGYLPRPGAAQSRMIRHLEQRSARTGSTEIFMETPYRNDQLISHLLDILQDTTKLCLAASLTLPEESTVTRTITEWKKERPVLHQQPVIYLLLAEPDHTTRKTDQATRKSDHIFRKTSHAPRKVGRKKKARPSGKKAGRKK